MIVRCECVALFGVCVGVGCDREPCVWANQHSVDNAQASKRSFSIADLVVCYDIDENPKLNLDLIGFWRASAELGEVAGNASSRPSQSLFGRTRPPLQRTTRAQ